MEHDQYEVAAPDEQTPTPPPPIVTPQPVSKPPSPCPAGEACVPCGSVAGMTHEEKMEEAMRRAAAKGLMDDIMDELPSAKELAVGIVVVGGTLMALGVAAGAVASTGVGAVIEGIAAAIVLGLAALGIWTSGVKIKDGIVTLMKFFEATRCDKAQTPEDLDAAGEDFADGVAKVGVGSIMMILSYFGGRKGVKMAKGARARWQARGGGLETRGYTPKPGERSMTKAEWKAQQRAARIRKSEGLPKRGYRPKPGERSITREQWKQMDRRWRAQRNAEGIDRPEVGHQPRGGHMHRDHGYQTSDIQHRSRVAAASRTNTTPVQPNNVNRSTRFDSPEAELEALGRARAHLRTEPRYNSDGTPAVRTVVVERGDGTGYGRGYQRQPYPPGHPQAGQSIPADSQGIRPTQPTPQQPNAAVVMQYNPSTGRWDPITGYPTDRPPN